MHPGATRDAMAFHMNNCVDCNTGKDFAECWHIMHTILEPFVPVNAHDMFIWVGLATVTFVIFFMNLNAFRLIFRCL